MNLDGRLRIWPQQHEFINPNCLVSTVQAAAGLRVWAKISWHTLCPLMPVKLHLNAVTRLGIDADHMHASIDTIYASGKV